MRRCIFCQFDNQSEATVCAACARPLPPQGPPPPELAALTQAPPASDPAALAVAPGGPSSSEPSLPEAAAPVVVPLDVLPSTEPWPFPGKLPNGVRYIIRVCFTTSALSLLVALGSSRYRHQLAVLGERMGGVNGPFLVLLALITLLAGFGLNKRWSAGWNLAMLAGGIGLIWGAVLIDDGGHRVLLGIALLALCFATLAYLVLGPVIAWFRQRATLKTSEDERPPSPIEAWLAGSGAGLARVKARRRVPDFLNFLGFGLLVAYGFVYLISLSGPVREFTSAQHRFRITAPQGWLMVRQPEAGAVVTLIRPDARGSTRNQPRVSVYVQSSGGAADDLSAEERTAWEQGWIRQAGAEQYPVVEATSLAGLLAWRMALDHPREAAKPERWLLAALKSDGKTFTLRCTAEAANFDDILPACNEVFEQFRFLP